VSSHTNTGGLWTRRELDRLFALGGYATARLDDAPKLAHDVVRFGHVVGLGSDTGGFNSLPGPGQPPLRYPFVLGGVTFAPQRTGERVFDLNRDGMAHYGLLPDLVADARTQPDGRRMWRVLMHSAPAYVRMWRRTGAAG
jgi:hypothetical protein